MEMTVGDQHWRLETGDCLSMRLDRPIVYKNPTRKARRRGVAQRLLAALDDAAREAGKSVLVLDTVTGGDAERLYQRAGWQRAGAVPKYALMPDGEFCGTTFFYKHL